jgi:hypothetical protein
MSDFHDDWPFEHGFPFRAAIRGTVRRLVASVMIPIAWFCGVLLFLAFFSTGFSYVQDAVIVVVSALLALAGLIGLWVSFGLKQARTWAGW